STESPGSFCTRPGQATGANACLENDCGPNPDDGPHEGVCQQGPVDRNCSIETYRGCTSDADCNPAPGNCSDGASGQVCTTAPRQCFLDTIVREGVPGTQTAVVAATFCIPPTISQ